MKFDRGGGSVNSHIGSGDGGGGGGSGNGSGGDSGSIGSAVTTESEVGREIKKTSKLAPFLRTTRVFLDQFCLR